MGQIARFFVLALLLISLTSFAFGAKSIVSVRVSGCDYFLVYVLQTADYTLMEWYSGYDPDKGDVLFGTMNEYGFHDIFSGDRESNVWIDDYGLDRADALEKLYEQCD